jgi:hypothetical protein
VERSCQSVLRCDEVDVAIHPAIQRVAGLVGLGQGRGGCEEVVDLAV